MLTRHHLREASRLLADYHPEEPMAYPENQASARTTAPDRERAQALRAVELPLDQLNRSIEEARERLNVQIKNTKNLADHLFGPEPEAGGANVGSPPRIGRLGNLHDAAEYLHGAIGELNRQLDRLAPLVG